METNAGGGPLGDTGRGWNDMEGPVVLLSVSGRSSGPGRFSYGFVLELPELFFFPDARSRIAPAPRMMGSAFFMVPRNTASP